MPIASALLKVITDGSLGTRTAACSHPYPGDPHNHGLLEEPDASAEGQNPLCGDEITVDLRLTDDQ